MPVATSSSFVFFSLDEAGVCDLFFDDKSSDARGTIVVLLVLGTRIIIARVLRLLLLLPLFLSLVVYFLRYKKIGGRIFKIQKNTSTLQKKKKKICAQNASHSHSRSSRVRPSSSPRPTRDCTVRTPERAARENHPASASRVDSRTTRTVENCSKKKEEHSKRCKTSSSPWRLVRRTTPCITY